MINQFLDDLRLEDMRLSRSLRLAANETLMSETARSISQLRIGESYYMGPGDDEQIVDFSPFTFGGRPSIAALEVAACNATKQMLRAESVRLQCLSGVHAMTCMILSLTEPDWTVFSLALDHGGHFATSMIAKSAGRKHCWIRLDDTGESFDLEDLSRQVDNPSKTLIYVDVSMNCVDHDLSGFRDAVGAEAVLLYDASHSLGLVMGGVFSNALDFGFDVLSGNSHKTLPGPHKAVVCFGNERTRQRAEVRLNAGLTSTVHPGSLLALAVALLEMEQFAPDYARACVENANYLGASLDELGIAVKKLSSGEISQNHQVHVKLPIHLQYRAAHSNLASNEIVANIDGAFGEPYLRIGVQYVTRMGMGADEMSRIAGLVKDSFENRNVVASVNELVAQFPSIQFSFDGT